MKGRRLARFLALDYLAAVSIQTSSSASSEAARTRTIAGRSPRLGSDASRALDVGGSLGVFTEMLAEHCDDVLGVDISEVSVQRARERLAGLEHVRFERRALPEDMPPGPFDLIVCADGICYWTVPRLRDALRALEAQLAPGGALLLVHYRPAVRIQPLRGDEAHGLVGRETRLEHVSHAKLGDHRLDLFEDRPPAAT